MPETTPFSAAQVTASVYHAPPGTSDKRVGAPSARARPRAATARTRAWRASWPRSGQRSWESCRRRGRCCRHRPPRRSTTLPAGYIREREARDGRHAGDNIKGIGLLSAHPTHRRRPRWLPSSARLHAVERHPLHAPERWRARCRRDSSPPRRQPVTEALASVAAAACVPRARCCAALSEAPPVSETATSLCRSSAASARAIQRNGAGLRTAPAGPQRPRLRALAIERPARTTVSAQRDLWR